MSIHKPEPTKREPVPEHVYCEDCEDPAEVQVEGVWLCRACVADAAGEWGEYGVRNPGTRPAR